MLLRLVAVSLMMTACASEALGATVNCTAASGEIDVCLRGPGQKKSFMQYNTEWLNGNVAGVTSLLKKKKTSGCIKASVWPDIQAWIKIFTPSKTTVAIMKSLSKAQIKTIVEILYDRTNKKHQKKAGAVGKVINEKYANLSEADKKEEAEWNTKFKEACGFV
uniref:Uncharacterized protein n=1 Tax=Plectus sambesii TaxID=2011161 RepID=A0A914XB53_9BILA